jgi:predicted kinase
MARVLDINARSLAATALVSPDATADFVRRFQAAFERLAPVMEARRRAGKVRRCHGDLILRNICLLDGTPVLFDCLEFDEELATIDVLYDLAFVLMDLRHRGLPDLANFLFNRYLDDMDETDGLSLLPFFMAVRAAVRAHVTAAQAQGAPDDKASSLREEARAYFDLALSLLRPSEPMLLAIGGFSGSGKSTVAARVAAHLGPAPGARILNTDRIRKQLHHLPVEQRLPPEAYRPEVSQKVYETLRKLAADALSQGFAVIADAVFDRPDERIAIEDVARSSHARFAGVWLEAPAAVLLPRIAARRHDPSDATADVLMAQLERESGEIRWTRIDAAGDPSRSADRVLDLLRPSR